MALIDDLTNLVERLIALDPHDHAAIAQIETMQEEGRARLANRGDRKMTVARTKAIEAREEQALERNRLLVEAIRQARAAGCKTYRDIGAWLTARDFKPTRGTVWNINILRYLEQNGTSRPAQPVDPNAIKQSVLT